MGPTSKDPVFIFHGGPGIPFDYLKEPLEFLSTSYELHFLNRQDSLFPKSDLDSPLENLLDEIHLGIRKILPQGQSFKIVAHSWGTYLAMKYCEKFGPQSISSLVLLNPMPLTAEMFGRSLVEREKLFSIRLSHWAKTFIQWGAGYLPRPIFDRLFIRAAKPAYVADSKHSKKLNFGRFSSRAFEFYISKLGDYDLRAQIPFLPSNTHVLWGREDFFKRDMSLDLAATPFKAEEWEGIGHMPFLESPEKFKIYLLKALSSPSDS